MWFDVTEFRSPGFGMTLWAQTKTGIIYCAEVVSNPKGSKDGPSVPDDLGKECATALLCEISKVGLVLKFVGFVMDFITELYFQFIC